MKAIEVKHFIKDGIKVVSVDLGNVDKSVILHEQDLQELLNLGASIPWKMASRHGLV
jgi:hypothetical protein